MDEFLTDIRRHIDEAARPVELVEIHATVARRQRDRRRRTLVMRTAAACGLLLVAGLTAAVLWPQPSPEEVAAGLPGVVHDCGAYEVSLDERSDPVELNELRPQNECLVAALSTGRPATLATLTHSMEGTPLVTTFLVTGPSEVVIVYDGTGDTFSSQSLGIATCAGVERTNGDLLLGQECAEAMDCGAFDVVSDSDSAEAEPVRSGVDCLLTSFQQGESATLSFAYNGGTDQDEQPTLLDFAYLVTGPEDVLVASRRIGEDVPPDLEFLIERCSVLNADNDGAPVASPDSCDPLLISHRAGERLEVPPPGEVRSEELRDGTAVWIVHHSDGTVSVLDAVSSHRPFGVGQLVGWCATASGFQDPQHGSVFDDRGRYQAGPAGVGLSRFTVSSLRDGGITVTGPPTEPRSDRGAARSNATGTDCVGASPSAGTDYSPGTLRLHDLAAAEGAELNEARQAKPGSMVVVRDAAILLTAGQTTVVCPSDLHRQSIPPRCDGLPAPGVELTGIQESLMLTGTFLARVTEDGLVDIAFTAGWEVVEGDRGEGDAPLFRDQPAPVVIEINDFGVPITLRISPDGRSASKSMRKDVAAAASAPTGEIDEQVTASTLWWKPTT